MTSLRNSGAHPTSPYANRSRIWTNFNTRKKPSFSRFLINLQILLALRGPLNPDPEAAPRLASINDDFQATMTGPAAEGLDGGRGRRHSLVKESEKEAAKAKAERRLREAEASFREAVENLQKQQEQERGNDPLCAHADSCVANAIGNLCQSFLLAYGVRVGIGILLRAFKLARRQSYRSLLDLKLLVSEKDLIVREEACRIGLLFGGFTGSFHAIRCLLRKVRGKETPLNGFLAGSVAGLSVLALDCPSRRRTLALYLLARLAQCAYNSAKSKNRFHFWGSHWRHGDSLLFAISSAQKNESGEMLMVHLKLRAVSAFISIAEPVYRAVQESCRGGPIDLVALSAFLSNRMGSQPQKLDPHAEMIPCSIIHPDASSCLTHNLIATYSTFRKTFPLYFSLTFVPFVILHLPKFMETPIRTCWTALKGAVRSTSFLSAFVGIFQAVICMHRKVAIKDHKLIYWFAGWMAALSVMLEKKNRRSELALYVLPRAGASFWYILVNRHLLPNIKNAEVLLFCLCMGGIMYYLEYEPDTMAPFLRGLIRRFLASRISTADDPPPKLGASYVNTLNSGHALNSEDKNSKSSTSSVKREEQLNLEAFSGL